MQDHRRAEEGREDELRRELHEHEARDEQLASELRRGERREGELEDELRELEEHKRKLVETIVSFPLAGKAPERVETPRHEKAEAVLRQTMAYFDVHDDETATYKLAHHGEQVNLATTVGELAEDERTLKLTLVKELIQG
jgi:hypothetical protein